MKLILVVKKTFFPDIAVFDADCARLFHGVGKRFGDYKVSHPDDSFRMSERDLSVILNVRSNGYIRQPSGSLVVPRQLIGRTPSIPSHLWRSVVVEKVFDAPFDRPDFLESYKPRLISERARTWILNNAKDSCGPQSGFMELVRSTTIPCPAEDPLTVQISYRDSEGYLEEVYVNLGHLELEGVTGNGWNYIFIPQLYDELAHGLDDRFFESYQVEV